MDGVRAAVRLTAALALLVALLVAPTAGCGSRGDGPESGSFGGDAACAAPVLSPESDQVVPGQVLTLQGEGFQDGCADAIGVNEATGEVATETVTPLRGLEVVWSQGSERRTLATVDAAEDHTIAVEVRVPATATPGTARITVMYSDVEVTVRDS